MMNIISIIDMFVILVPIIVLFFHTHFLALFAQSEISINKNSHRNHQRMCRYSQFSDFFQWSKYYKIIHINKYLSCHESSYIDEDVSYPTLLASKNRTIKTNSTTNVCSKFQNKVIPMEQSNSIPTRRAWYSYWGK